MSKFKGQVVIRQPVDKVFDFVTNIHNNTKWQTGFERAEVTSDGPFGEGSTYRCVNRFLGMEIVTEGKVTAYEPDRYCAYRFASRAVEGEGWFVFTPVAEGTEFTASGEADLTGFRLGSRIAARTIEHQLRHDMKILKSLLEDGKTGGNA